MTSPWCWSEAVSRCLTCLLTLTAQGGLPQCMCKGQDKHVLSVVSQKATGERQSRTGLSEHPKNPDLCESGCKPFQVNVTYWCPGISFNWNQRKGDPFGVNGGGESDFSNFILISGIKAPQPLNETLLMRIPLHLNYFYFLSASLCAWGWGQSGRDGVKKIAVCLVEGERLNVVHIWKRSGYKRIIGVLWGACCLLSEKNLGVNFASPTEALNGIPQFLSYPGI